MPFQADYFQVAERIGFRLCRDAIWAGDQCNWLGWMETSAGEHDASHYGALDNHLYQGTPGVALFLARLYALGGDTIVRRTALAACQRCVECPRTSDDGAGLYLGRGGLALAVLECGKCLASDRLLDFGLRELRELGELAVRSPFDRSPAVDDLEASTRTSVNQRSSLAFDNFCLYNGASGHADALLIALSAQDRSGWRETVQSIADHGLRMHHRADVPWPCGIDGRGETPGLMPGLSGIGYFYLRAADPDAVPSVFLLRQREEPVSSDARRFPDNSDKEFIELTIGLGSVAQ